jgi:hypothetical protein
MPHVYWVPAGMMPEPGVTLKVACVQIGVVKLKGCGAGLSETVNVNVEPQVPIVVIEYTAVTTFAVVLVSVPVIEFRGVVSAAPPVKPVPVGALQVYWVLAGTVPFTPSVGVTVNIANPQATAVIGLIIATGLTVTVNTKGVAGPQRSGLGVIV